MGTNGGSKYMQDHFRQLYHGLCVSQNAAVLAPGVGPDVAP